MKTEGETALMGQIVPLHRLAEEGYGEVICYPRFNAEELGRRVDEMKELGVESLCFSGKKKINEIPVLGKGCVGIVILACTKAGRVALKIRRTDADGGRIKHEAEMLRIANYADVGPNLLGFTEDLLMTEFIDGTLLPAWLETPQGDEDMKPRVRRVLRDILEQCWRLDEIGLDHGELSRAPKHIIVDAEDKPWLLDFETASVARRVSNVTSVCQYLFMRRKLGELVGGKIGEINRANLLEALRAYKNERTKPNFEVILRACLL